MRALFVFAGLLFCFNTLFWQQGLGINLPIFSLLLVGTIYFIKRPALNTVHYFLLIGTVLSNLSLIVLHTDMAIATSLITTIALAGSLQYQNASVLEGLVNGVYNWFNPKQGVVPGFEGSPALKKNKGVLILRVAAFPLVIFFLYMLLFSAGNSIFNSLTGDFLEQFGRFFKDWSFPHIMFLVLGALFIRWAMRTKHLKGLYLSANSQLSRKSQNNRKKVKFHPLVLRWEYLRALVLFGSLNVLFLIVNVIDVKWVWFQFSVQNGFNLKDFVHEGTGYLIVSILLSIVLVMYFFRGKLNYYPNNKWLKRLGYAWIVQNMILSLSVFIRTLHYINFHGLAGRRIGLMIFLSMVFFGLITLMIKIGEKKNLAYMLRVNSAFIVGALVFSACLPWNYIILNHNLNHYNISEIDVDNYLNLKPHVYHVVYSHLDVIERQIEAHQKNPVHWISYTNIEDFKASLDRRKKYFEDTEASQGIWSWNFADAVAVYD